MKPILVGKVYRLGRYQVVVENIEKTPTWQIFKNNKLLKKTAHASTIEVALQKAKKFVFKHDGIICRRGKWDFELIGKLFKFQDYDIYISKQPFCFWRVLKNNEIVQPMKKSRDFKTAIVEAQNFLISQQQIAQ
ncbi:MAG: hypothetical protein ACOCQR_02380 [bacterium]